MKENKPHTPLDFFSWRCQFGGLNPRVSRNHPHGGGRANSPQFHQLWCSSHSTADPPNSLTAPMPKLMVQSIGQEKLPSLSQHGQDVALLCCWLSEAGTQQAQDTGWGHWQPPTTSLPLTLWCLYHTRHLLTFQCSLHLYFPKKHPDQNCHLSDLNYF